MRRRRIPQHLRVQVLARDHYRCLMCGASRADTTLHVDHIVPVVEGGTDELDNLATLCRECNQGKAAHRFGNYRELRAASPLNGHGRSPMQRWQAVVGKAICIDPLTGHPEWPTPDPWFIVSNVTDSDVSLYKRSCQQYVTLPLESLGSPWGPDDNLRASVKSGVLAFVPAKRAWEWNPVAK